MRESQLDWPRATTADDWLRASVSDPQPVSVGIDSLVLSDSPRQAGEDPAHTRMLADLAEALPPIAVHRPTMRVIDGTHRVRAALLAGKSRILAKLYDCSEDAAFILSVKANVTHGLPLLLTDRRAAAERVINTHPDWSDRAVAAVTGLSDKTVGTLRDSSSAEPPQSNARMGRDGRLRPLNSADQRRHAAKIINENPGAGLREITDATGLSLATAHDVRQRLLRNEDPVPSKYRANGQAAPEATAAGPAPESAPAAAPVSARNGRQAVSQDRTSALAAMKKDPSLRLTESGRHLLRWLHLHTIEPDDCGELVDAIPRHWASLVADLARSCAESWLDMSKELKRRAEHDT